MRQKDLQLGKIHGDIVDVNRIPVLISRAGKNRSPRVEHHWDSVGLSGAVYDLELLHPGQVSVRK